MMILKNTRNLNSTKKYQIFCFSFIFFNIFMAFFTYFVSTTAYYPYWYDTYRNFFRDIFESGYGFDWILNWIYNLSYFIFLFTGILFIYKKNDYRFLIANILLQSIGILSQLLPFFEFRRWIFSDFWWYGDSPWVKTFFHLLNLIGGIFIYRYYRKHQKAIDNANFESYYLSYIICITAGFFLAFLGGYIRSEFRIWPYIV